MDFSLNWKKKIRMIFFADLRRIEVIFLFNYRNISIAPLRGS